MEYREAEGGAFAVAEFNNGISACGVIAGILIQDDTMSPQEIRYLSTVGHEELYLWCADRNDQCHLCSKPTNDVFQVPYWKTVAALLRLSIGYVHCFETIEMPASFEYIWLESFEAINVPHRERKSFYIAEELQMNSGLAISIQEFNRLVPLMELLNKNEKLYTALSLLYSSLEQHFCCMLCEMDLTGHYHMHQAEELPIWQHVMEIPKLELAVIQACRAAEAILGEPPSRKAQGKVDRFVRRWIDTIGGDPEKEYTKAGKTYLDFYYELFDELRNPSAHSRGDVHYSLARIQTIVAQCFAFQVFEGYLGKMEDNL